MKFNIIFSLVAIFIILSQLFKVWWPSKSFDLRMFEPENLPFLIVFLIGVVMWAIYVVKKH